MIKYFLPVIAVFIGLNAISQQSIENARSKVGQEITVGGIVTNGGEFGRIRYFQDETAGLSAYGNAGTVLQRGDSATITGTLKNYRNLLEIDPITSVTVHTSNNPVPQPQLITVDQIGENHESQLVQINDVQFKNPSGTFEGDKNYSLTDGTKSFEIRINRNATSIVGQQIPTGNLNLAGIVSQYSYNQNDVTTGYQLLPRDLNDLMLTGAVNIISPVTVQNITKSGFTLSWKTDSEAIPEVIYGATPNREDWRDITTGTTSSVNDEYLHEVQLRGLEPGAVVYAMPYAHVSTDTAFAALAAYATESNSTGEINVYFNTDVDTGFAVHSYAQNIGGALDDTLVAYIDRASESVDFAIYSFSNISSASIPDALNRAAGRGVQVRVIACGTNQNPGLNDLNSEIPVFVAPDDNNRDGIMHNKFAVIDAESVDSEKPMVWSGSTNISYNQVVSDANSMIFIQDQALARAYKIEFEEMWGSNGAYPNEGNAKFGAEKSDNTPHEFVIGGNRVESYFSPSDGTNQQIINAINAADNNLNIATMLITRTDVALAIEGAKNRGAAVNVLTEGDANTETVNSILLDALGNESYVFDAEYGILHHKYAVVDNSRAEFDPLVVTGSHNWSNSANEINDENTLVIHNGDIANQYYQNFAARFKANGGQLKTPAAKIEFPDVKIYPNPVVNRLTIQHTEKIAMFKLYSGSGQLIQIFPVKNERQTQLNMGAQTPGLYFLSIILEDGSRNTFKLIKK
jgi:phosphatidylserine/phosphatidylglycerophosphate/cardiolipin synthase-like enzyme